MIAQFEALLQGKVKGKKRLYSVNAQSGAKISIVGMEFIISQDEVT